MERRVLTRQSCINVLVNKDWFNVFVEDYMKVKYSKLGKHLKENLDLKENHDLKDIMI